MGISLKEVRARYPRYASLSDSDLTEALYEKFYHDMPREQFDKKVADSGDLVEQVLSGFTSAVDAVPVVGPAALNGLENLKAWVHGVPVETVQADTQRMRDENPSAAGIGGIAGTALPFVAAAEFAVPARLLGIDGAVAAVPRTLANTAATSAITTGDKLARGYGW